MAKSAPKPAPEEQTVLVLQGGGALGAYQAGAFEQLAQQGCDPGWVAGISIGAINAAIICGNPAAERVEKLRTFWTRITSGLAGGNLFGTLPDRHLLGEMASAAVIASGVEGFFKPRLPAAAFMPGVLASMTSFYDTSPLIKTLHEVVDFDYLNDHGPRICVGAVHVTTGNFAYFDSAEERIGPEHIMASGALPPGFPAVEINGHWYWDGGLVSNTPLQYVLQNAANKPLCIFQVDLFSARGDLPGNLVEVASREKDIRYSSRTRLVTDIYKKLSTLSMAGDRLYEKLPPEFRDDPDLAMIRDATPGSPMTLVQLIHRKEDFESASKDYEFSRLSMAAHWASGRNDVKKTLSHKDWIDRDPSLPGLQTFDLATADV